MVEAAQVTLLTKLQKHWVDLWHGSANRIAFWWAVRGTVATALPLLLLPLFGVEQGSRLIAIGALNTSMVDVGGSYRSRLGAMGLNAVLSPVALFLGVEVRDDWLLATCLIFVIALGSGLARALGPSATPLGLLVGSTFLVGTNIPGVLGQPIEWAALYCLGGLWTVFIALVFWRLRPFKRLEQEVASAWEAVAIFIAVIGRVDSNVGRKVGARGRRERLLARRHVAAREAIERARLSLGEVRQDISGAGVTIAHLMILVRTAAWITEAHVSIAEVRQEEGRYTEGCFDAAILNALMNAVEQAVRGVIRSLLSGTNQLSLAAVQDGFRRLVDRSGTADPEVRCFAQVVQQLESAQEILKVLFSAERRFASIIPPLTRTTPRGFAVGAIRAQLSFSSAIFRHALRVATAGSISTAVMLLLKLPHGIWLPMTTLIVLQPEFGSTLRRALQRTAGTIAGAAIAGMALATLHGTLALTLLLTALMFVAFFVQRRQYGLGVTFLTPLIVLLITTTVGDQWIDTLDRVTDTLAGAMVGIGSSYLLWPQWERQRLPALLARAIRATCAYMARVLEALARSEGERPGQLRRRAEIAIGNAEAGFQRLLTEPARHRGNVSRAFAILTYTRRLERHLIALAAQIGTVQLPGSEISSLSVLLETVQEEIALAITAGRRPQPCPPLDSALERVTTLLVSEEARSPGSTISFLLSRVVSDTASLHSAAMDKSGQKPSDAVGSGVLS